MKATNTFKKHGKKLLSEALIRSVLCGIATGFAAIFIAALVLWFTPVNGLWICIGVFVAVSLIASLLFYLIKFRPTEVKSARRLDSLGLQERLITMVEYKKDDSYMANLQRNDAKSALSRLDVKKLKIIIPRAIVISLCICLVLGTGMTTVNALSESGVIQSGEEILNSFVEEQMTEYVSVSYIIEEGGIIEGDEEQVIVKGTDAATVTAVADEGFVFKEWSDGYTSPTRTDTEITEDVVYTAIFTELGDESGDGEGEDGDGEEGDEPKDAPSEPSDSNSDGGQNSEGNPNSDSQNGGGNIADPANKIIDNDKYYRDIIGELATDTDERLENTDGSLSQDEIDIIKKYLGIV
jgi:hypothetical protein